jgi:hypothetical protein
VRALAKSTHDGEPVKRQQLWRGARWTVEQVAETRGLARVGLPRLTLRGWQGEGYCYNSTRRWMRWNPRSILWSSSVVVPARPFNARQWLCALQDILELCSP